MCYELEYVLQSIVHYQNVTEHAMLQDIWFEEELEQCKLCAMQIVVFSHHVWFDDHAEEPDPSLGQGQDKYMSQTLRDKWLPKMRHEKIKFVFCGNSADVVGEGSIQKPYLKKANSGRESKQGKDVCGLSE